MENHSVEKLAKSKVSTEKNKNNKRTCYCKCAEHSRVVDMHDLHAL